MLTGLNTDVEYQGRVYHVQTEDGGMANPVVVTTLFDRGAILATQKTSYAEILRAQDLQRILRDLMHEQHKGMIKDLKAGRFTQAQGIPPSEPASPDLPRAAKTSKSLDDMIFDYLSIKEERQK